MVKRNFNEVEKDYRRIKKVVDTTPVTSIKDIAEATNLSVAEVNTSLLRHPQIKEKILLQLEKNRNERKAKRKAEKEAQKAKEKAQEKTQISENKAESKQEFRLKNEALEVKNNAEQQAKTESESKQDTEYDVGYVIDASITGIENLRAILSDLCHKNNTKLILTSMTIKELDKLQKIKDIQGYDAIFIMDMALENDDCFLNVLIDESLDTPDDCIVKYCIDHKDKVVLLTSDKRMALDAKSRGVKTQYFKQTSAKKQSSANTVSRKNTLLIARKLGEQLFVTALHNNRISIMVISNGIEHIEGVCELKIGDDVYLATKRLEYLTFAHYQITSLEAVNNCNLIFSKRIYYTAEIKTLPKSSYVSFMSDFNERVKK